jgi:hypothetical protein
MGRAAAVVVLALALAAAGAGCASKEAAPVRTEGDPESSLPPDQRDAEALGREVFELVDRAVDFRGSHQGRPAATFRQMGIDSLAPATVRRLVNLAREPVVTVTFRRTDGHEIVSCRGDGQILEEASLNGGRFTVMCTAASGAQRPIKVGATDP